jgi:hypothetical protein
MVILLATKRRVYCKFCNAYFYDVADLVAHLEKEHGDMIPEDMDAWQFAYFLRTGKKAGSCVVCKKPTTWNDKTHKYNRFCNNQKCKEKYVETFKSRMIGKYGKTNLLNDPEQQRIMLAKRKISGEYLWRDHVHKSNYVGSYEKSFLEFLDKVLAFDPTDVISPSPHTYYYEYNGERHFYIPDFFITSLNLEVEIKDGGDNPNKMKKIQEVDKVKEALKDEVMKSNMSTFNYIKIVDKKNEKFLAFLEKMKENYYEGIDEHIVML